jgi:AcrR family transcriptional regulator
MSRGIQPEAAQKTKQSIHHAFLELYDEMPFEQISVKLLCKKANVSRNTFYRYYANTESLFDEIVMENSVVYECVHIIKDFSEMTLESATDLIADFYDARANTIRILATGNRKSYYLNWQVRLMKPMFQSLITRAVDLTAMQLDYAADYIARAKVGMIEMWVEKGQCISLNQISRLTENIIESQIWTAVALQSPQYGGPAPKSNSEKHFFDYPWQKVDKKE